MCDSKVVTHKGSDDIKSQTLYFAILPMLPILTNTANTATTANTANEYADTLLLKLNNHILAIH
jgi:hypothetical protein